MDDCGTSRAGYPHHHSDGSYHLSPGPREWLAAWLRNDVPSLRFTPGRRWPVSGTPHDAVASGLARRRYWQAQGLTFDQAADAAFFEQHGRGPWRDRPVPTEMKMRGVASGLTTSCRRVGIAPLDCLVKYPIEVR